MREAIREYRRESRKSRTGGRNLVIEGILRWDILEDSCRVIMSVALGWCGLRRRKNRRPSDWSDVAFGQGPKVSPGANLAAPLPQIADIDFSREDFSVAATSRLMPWQRRARQMADRANDRPRL
jgi:hypothetical protein